MIAQALSLSGVYFSLDAACASSLYSVKLACDYLLFHKADMMLAGAVSAGDPFFVNMGLSNDGRGQSVLSPNPKGQITAFERAYANADIDPKSIDYVECHATGTPLGDKAELNSMDTFFGKHGATPLVGSVKSSLGHLLTAAGMASMIKVILSMAEGIIPATINLKEAQSSLNHVIAANLIPDSSTPWPHTQPCRHAAVSAFFSSEENISR